MKCQNCGSDFEGNFCPHCGSPASVPVQPTPESAQEYQPQPTPVQQTYYAPPVATLPPKKKNKGCLIGVIVAVVLVILFIVVVAFSSGDKKGGDTTQPTASVDVQAQTEAPPQQTEAPPPQTQPNAPEQVMFDQNGIKIIFKSLDKTGGFMGPDVKIRIENSTDQPYTVQVRDFSVNGYMVDPLFSCDVAPGKMANDEITIMSTSLEENDITKIETIEMSFEMFNTDTWDGNIKSGKVTIKF